MDEKRPILTRIIIEMVGSPKEHIEGVLKDYIDKLKESPDFTIVSSELAEAQEQEKYFAAFAELEIRFKNLNHVVAFCFEAMPASIEIVEPDGMQLSNNDLSGLLNDIQGKLHQIEMVAKKLKSEVTLLNQNSIELLRNFVRYLIKEGNNTVDQIAELIGIQTEELEPFLQRMVEENQLNLEKEAYALPK